MTKLVEDPYSYPEVGATSGELPVGYRHVHRRALLGRGPVAFQLAGAMLMSWQMHRRAGLAVAASGATVQAGVVVVLGLGWRVASQLRCK